MNPATTNHTLTLVSDGQFLTAWAVENRDIVMGYVVVQDTGYEAHVGKGVWRPYRTREEAVAKVLNQNA